MTVLAAGAVSITDGAIVIPAETVARRLCLKLEALQAEMQRQQPGEGDCAGAIRRWSTVSGAHPCLPPM